MIPIRLTVNGRKVSEMAEPRMHLADFLRDKMNLTGTHLRCEQGVCGACTVLIDGQPARSCITYAALCQDAEITTIEGLVNDPVMVVLRRSFTSEHGLQCGFCTPGMLITARDIALRLPNADETRVRAEISGNLCRCTGYVGIVRAICRALGERRAEAAGSGPPQRHGLGPVGARPAEAGSARQVRAVSVNASEIVPMTAGDETHLGLGSRKPNIQMRKQVTVARPPGEVWAALCDLDRVAGCLPGARLTSVSDDDRFEGEMAVKLGPMSATFGGRGRIDREAAAWRGRIVGTGQDRTSRSQTAGEVEYQLSALDGGETTQIDITLKAILSGPLAQFGRSRIVDDLTSRIIETFARNLGQMLAGSGEPPPAQQALSATSLLWSVLVARLKALGRWLTRQ
jgi:aerobic carbon-monoxide dehydrogenase small subunit